MKKVNMGRKVDLGRKIELFKHRFKTCFDAAKSKISKSAAIPTKKYGFTKQKHIRGDKTLQIRSKCRIFGGTWWEFNLLVTD